jgi:hypothetical protein
MPFGWLLRDLSDAAITYVIAIAIAMLGVVVMVTAALVALADIFHNWRNDA